VLVLGERTADGGCAADAMIERGSDVAFAKKQDCGEIVLLRPT
jgi:hypothetical protein